MYINEYGDKTAPIIILLAPMMVSGQDIYEMMKPHMNGIYHIIAPDQGGHGKAGAYVSADQEYAELKDGVDVPFQSLGLTKEGYIKRMADEKKAHGENYGRDMWEEAVRKAPNEASVIQVENICGRILFLGSETDTCWDCTTAASRMKARIEEKGGAAKVRIVSYPHGCHLLYPDMVPFINFMTWMAFKEYKKYPKECKAARADVSGQILKEIKNW